MSSGFLQNLKPVTIVHIGLVVLLMLLSGVEFFFRKKPKQVIPINFVLEQGTSGTVQLESPAPVKPTPKPKPTPPKPKPIPPKPKPTPPKPKPVPKPTPPRPKPLTDKQIKEALSEAIKTSNPALVTPGPTMGSSMASEEAINLEIIRRVLYNAWEEPSAEVAGNAVAEVEIRLQLDGRIIDRKLVKSSGNQVMDESVMKAARMVSYIPELTPLFLKNWKTVVIAFKVEQ